VVVGILAKLQRAGLAVALVAEEQHQVLLVGRVRLVKAMQGVLAQVQVQMVQMVVVGALVLLV
jgi:hypothetical protein